MSITKGKFAGAALLIAVIVACSPGVPAPASAQKRTDVKPPATDPIHEMKIPASDSAFSEMQKRGQMAMGVDQYTSQHKFDITPDGGRIELQRATPDSLDVAQIRAHMKLIQHAFAAGDFSTPAFVHMKDMPGTDIMSKKRDLISYTYGDLPLGAEVRISTRDAEAKAAITRFLSAQRMEHRAGGEGHKM